VRLPPGFRKITGNLGWLYADQIIRMILSTIVVAWMARAMGPSQFGSYSFVLTVVTALTAIAGLAIDPLIVRDLSRSIQNPSAISENGVLGSAFVLRLVMSILCMAASVAIIAFIIPGDRTAMATSAVMALSILAQPFLLTDFWFRAHYQTQFTVLARITSALSSNALRVILLLIHAPLPAYGIPVIMDFAVLAFGMKVLYSRQGGQMSAWRPVPAEVKRLARQTTPLLFSCILVLAQARLDVFFIAKYLPKDQLGFYSAALRLTEIGTQAPLLLLTVLEPFVARHAAQGHDQLRSAMRTAYRINAIVSMLPALPMLLAPGFIIHVLFGDHYGPAVPLLMLSVGRLFIGSIGVTKSLFLINKHIYWRSTATSIVGVALSACLNILLIPSFGVYGAVFASFLSFFCTTILMDLLWADLRENLRNMLIGTSTPFSFRLHDLEHD
jgi:PST family polysaccharide transporter